MDGPQMPQTQTDSAPSGSSTSNNLLNTSGTDTDYFNVNALKDYILSGGDTLMFQDSWLKIWEVIIIILGISTRFSMSLKGFGL